MAKLASVSSKWFAGANHCSARSCELPAGRLRGAGWVGDAVPCQWCGKPVVFIEQPGISGLGREQDKLTDRDDSSVVSGGAALNIAYLIGETKVLAVNHALAWCTLDGSSGGGHGPVHQAARRSSHLRLSLLRSHCHSRLPERTVAA